MNSTNCTGASIAQQHGYNGSIASNRSTTNQQGNLAFVAGRLLREAISRPFEALQKYWNKPSSEQLALNRQKVIYLEGLKGFAQQLDNACVRMAQNPNDAHLLKRIEKLADEYPQYIQRHEREDYRDFQEREFKRVETCVSKIKPALQKKLKPLLPVVFEKMKIRKEANETSAKLSDTHKVETRETIKQKEQRDQPKGKNELTEHQHQKRKIGECPPSAEPINLSQLNAIDGFAFEAPIPESAIGPISTTGDLTGDNITEFMVGARYASFSNTTVYAGKVWIINGGQDFTKLNLSDFTSANGVVIQGLNQYDGTGSSLAPLGDFTNDGKNAIIIGAQSLLGFGSQNGTAYILIAPIQNTINLATLNGSNGLQIIGSKFKDYLGYGVAGGDVNGDKIPDAVIGSFGASPNGTTQAGAVYVIFGGPGPWPAKFDINSLDGTNGLIIYGANNSQLGTAISVGDFDGDGIDDIAATAPGTPALGSTGTCMVYVILGQNSTSWTSPMNVTSLNGINGFAAYGPPSDFPSNTFVNIGGDLNRDGKQDLSVGSPGGNPNSIPSAGSLYILFKQPTPPTALVNLAALNSTDGIELDGTERTDGLGTSSAIIDINNDGYPDVAIGIPGRTPGTISGAGAMANILGEANGLTTENLASLNGSNGFLINGIVPEGQLGSSIANLGDISGDGLDDLGAVAPYAGNGTFYIILGKNTSPCPPPTTTPTTTAPTSSTTTSPTSTPTSSTTTSPTSTPTSSTSIPPTTAATTTHAATSAATQAPSSGSSFDVKALAIGLAVGIAFLVGLVVAATVYLRYKKKGCFADDEQAEPARHDAQDLYKDL